MEYSPTKDALREAVERATWIGFDLDDTLHHFPSSPTTEILMIVNRTYPEETNADELKETYRQVLRTGTSNAFTDGRTSHEYRRDRFRALLSRSRLPVEDEFVQYLLDQYDDRYSKAICLTDGVESLLGVLRSKGKKIMVITEGPQDAQERTVKQLLDGRVDALVTTNKWGVSKVDGLFAKVLKRYDIKPDQMVFIGDNPERDVTPALKEGIFAVHFDEKEQNSFAEQSTFCTLSKFADLQEFLSL